MLPIDAAIPDLHRALASASAAVLQAPPGAGKTTRIPLALLHESWLADRRIVMLEPRRLAARAAARYMSAARGETAGQTIGFRVRGETRVSRTTRIEVVTEGVLTRMLQSDPSLDGVGCVIFDEFHERSVHADLGLALTLQSQALLRPDLRILVMSATLDGAPIARLLDDAPIITSEGREYPVETRYVERPPDRKLELLVARVVREAVASHEGDVLVFLPGAAEIHRTAAALAASSMPATVTVMPLFGALSAAEQDRAIAASPPGRRKIVLATSIAETSLTIDGVRIVIDSGVARVPRFSPRSGMSRLETVRVSRASADQRRGRAGRQSPGVCYRLWAEHEQHLLVAQNQPEILDADLAPLALELAAAGVTDPGDLRWLTAPPASSYAQATHLLTRLGALGTNGRITEHGRAMADLPVHPRIAHLLLRGSDLGVLDLAGDVAALLGDRDIMRVDRAGANADLTLRVDALRDGGASAAAHGASVDRDGLRRARAESGELRRQLGGAASPPSRSGTVQRSHAPRAASSRDRNADLPGVGVLVAFAYPDRIAQRRTGQAGRYALSGGGGASLAGAQALTSEEYLAVADLDGQATDARIYLAAPLTLHEIEEHFTDAIVEEDAIEWDPASRAVAARRRRMLGALVLRESGVRDPDPERVARVLLDGVLRGGIQSLAWSDAATRLRERLAFLHAHDPSWPDVSDAALDDAVREWLLPRVAGMRRASDVDRVDLSLFLLDRLDWRQRRALDELAPTHLAVPSGSRVALDYSDPEAPVLAVRLQEMFGLRDTPRVAGGRVGVVLHLLSPARRPVQITRDLAGFWTSAYFEVRKDLRGRYPRHHWPEDPLEAPPTRGIRRPSGA